MFLITPIRNDHFQAQIRLANGQIAGEGYGASKKTAMYFACLDAIHNGYPQAATGHASYLSIRDENVVRDLAGQPQQQMNPRKRNSIMATHKENRSTRQRLCARCVEHKYEIYSYPAGRSLSGPISGYLVKVQHGDGSWVTERARTLRGAETKLDKTSQWNWRYENEFQKRYGVPAENPFVMDTKEKVGVALGVAAGLAALIYYVMKKPAATTTTTSTSVTPTLQLQPGGARVDHPRSGRVHAYAARRWRLGRGSDRRGYEHPAR